MPRSGDWDTDEITLLRAGPESPPEPSTSVAGKEGRPPAPGPGDVLSRRYTLLRHIGVGGMGQVFEASHRAFERTLAVKVLLAELWEPGATGAAARFTREAKAASTLSHENVAKTLDVGQTRAGLPYIVMEYLEGEDLGTILDSGPLPWPRVRRLFEQLLAALSHAHERGVVHRDLKPENCLIVEPGTPDEQLKLLDFGIARVLDDANADKLTRTGTIVGTPHYMSPEQALGKQVGPASDIYSAGVLLFELLTGSVPFDSGTPLQIATQHITQTPPRISEVAPGLQLPSHVEAAVDIALQKETAARHRSATAFVRALAGPVTAPAPAPTLVPTPAPVSVETSTAAAPSTDSNPESKRMISVLIGVAVLVPLAVLAAYGVRTLREETPPPTPAMAEADVEPSTTGPARAALASAAVPEEAVVPDVAAPRSADESEEADDNGESGSGEVGEPDAPVPAKVAVGAPKRPPHRPPPPDPVPATDAPPVADRPPAADPEDPAEEPPHEAEEPPELPKRLSEARIRRALQRRLRKCDQAGTSRVRLDVAIRAKGTTEKVRVLPPYAHSPVADCIVRALDGANLGQAQSPTTFTGRVEVGRSGSSEGE